MTVKTTLPLGARTSPPQAGYTKLWFWLAGTIATAGVVAGVILGFTNYNQSLDRIDAFDRVAIPGTMTTTVDQPARLVVYYEGTEVIGFDDLAITVTGPSNDTLQVDRFQGELIYDGALGQGRAMAAFDADFAGDYQVEVGGAENGVLVVGESIVRIATPGILAGLLIAGAGVGAGFVLALWPFATSSRRRLPEG